MSELKTYKFLGIDEIYPCANLGNDYYLKYDVDRAVEEKDKEITELKAKLEDAKASHYAEMVDAGMRERRLRRALWLAHAYKAKFKKMVATSCA